MWVPSAALILGRAEDSHQAEPEPPSSARSLDTHLYGLMIFCPYFRAPSQSCMYRHTPMAWYIMCSMYTLLSSNTELIFSWLSSQISSSSLGGAQVSRRQAAAQVGWLIPSPPPTLTSRESREGN